MVYKNQTRKSKLKVVGTCLLKEIACEGCLSDPKRGQPLIYQKVSNDFMILILGRILILHDFKRNQSFESLISERNECCFCLSFSDILNVSMPVDTTESLYILLIYRTGLVRKVDFNS